MDTRYFTKKVVQWYQQNKRDLPWRETNDPYRIWLSEIILQQTRVAQGLPYYLKFVETFPTVQQLAAAGEQKVLRLWQGLGYYSRARNLHKCARQVVTLFNGQFPSSFEGLKKLPGIGDYTAAAIASIAFGESVAVVDGNVYRVLSRVFGIHTAINSPQGKKMFSELANKLVPQRGADLFNQGMMEFGALYCTPKNPACSDCIFSASCQALKHDLQTVLPVKKPIKKTKKRYFYYFVMQNGKSVLMKRRGEKDIWHGLFDFYLVEKKKAYSPIKILSEDKGLQKLAASKKKPDISGVYKQILSHQIIYSRFIQLESSGNKVQEPGLKYYAAKQIAQLPKPVLISRYLADYQLL